MANKVNEETSFASINECGEGYAPATIGVCELDEFENALFEDPSVMVMRCHNVPGAFACIPELFNSKKITHWITRREDQSANRVETQWHFIYIFHNEHKIARQPQTKIDIDFFKDVPGLCKTTMDKALKEVSFIRGGEEDSVSDKDAKRVICEPDMYFPAGKEGHEETVKRILEATGRSAKDSVIFLSSSVRMLPHIMKGEAYMNLAKEEGFVKKNVPYTETANELPVDTIDLWDSCFTDKSYFPFRSNVVSAMIHNDLQDYGLRLHVGSMHDVCQIFSQFNPTNGALDIKNPERLDFIKKTREEIGEDSEVKDAKDYILNNIVPFKSLITYQSVLQGLKEKTVLANRSSGPSVDAVNASIEETEARSGHKTVRNDSVPLTENSFKKDLGENIKVQHRVLLPALMESAMSPYLLEMKPNAVVHSQDPKGDRKAFQWMEMSKEVFKRPSLKLRPKLKLPERVVILAGFKPQIAAYILNVLEGYAANKKVEVCLKRLCSDCLKDNNLVKETAPKTVLTQPRHFKARFNCACIMCPPETIDICNGKPTPPPGEIGKILVGLFRKSGHFTSDLDFNFNAKDKHGDSIGVGADSYKRRVESFIADLLYKTLSEEDKEVLARTLFERDRTFEPATMTGSIAGKYVNRTSMSSVSDAWSKPEKIKKYMGVIHKIYNTALEKVLGYIDIARQAQSGVPNTPDFKPKTTLQMMLRTTDLSRLGTLTVYLGELTNLFVATEATKHGWGPKICNSNEKIKSLEQDFLKAAVGENTHDGTPLRSKKVVIDSKFHVYTPTSTKPQDYEEVEGRYRMGPHCKKPFQKKTGINGFSLKRFYPIRCSFYTLSMFDKPAASYGFGERKTASSYDVISAPTFTNKSDINSLLNLTGLGTSNNFKEFATEGNTSKWSAVKHPANKKRKSSESSSSEDEAGEEDHREKNDGGDSDDSEKEQKEDEEYEEAQTSDVPLYLLTEQNMPIINRKQKNAAVLFESGHCNLSAALSKRSKILLGKSLLARDGLNNCVRDVVNVFAKLGLDFKSVDNSVMCHTVYKLLQFADKVVLPHGSNVIDIRDLCLAFFNGLMHISFGQIHDRLRSQKLKTLHTLVVYPSWEEGSFVPKCVTGLSNDYGLQASDISLLVFRGEFFSFENTQLNTSRYFTRFQMYGLRADDINHVVNKDERAKGLLGKRGHLVNKVCEFNQKDGSLPVMSFALGDFKAQFNKGGTITAVSSTLEKFVEAVEFCNRDDILESFVNMAMGDPTVNTKGKVRTLASKMIREYLPDEPDLYTRFVEETCKEKVASGASFDEKDDTDLMEDGELTVEKEAEENQDWYYSYEDEENGLAASTSFVQGFVKQEQISDLITADSLENTDENNESENEMKTPKHAKKRKGDSLGSLQTEKKSRYHSSPAK